MFATLQFLVLTLECPGPVPLLGFLGAFALAPTAKFTGLLVGPLAAACVVVAAARGSRAVYVPFVGGRARLLGYWAGIGVLATAATYGALVLAYQGEWALTTFRNGIRLIYRHVTGKGHPIFLDSRISGSGFREYYLRAILYKTPTATLAAFVLALLVPTGAARARWLVPAGLGALVLGYFSLSGYTLGLRYPLVVFPLLYVACGRLAAPGGRQRVRRAGAAAIVLLTLAGTSSPPSRSGRMGTGCHRSLPPCSGSSSR